MTPIMEIVSFPSIITAVMHHYEVDAWRWEPGMLALPGHDEPWWYSDGILSRAFVTPGRKVTPVI